MGSKLLNAILISIIVILVVTLVAFTAILTTITVDGNSMSPSLADGDRLMLVKHGYKLNRGDIVVFTREGRNNVKRILGLEGDVIKFDAQNMTWVVNDIPYVEDYIEDGYSDNYFAMSNKDVLAELFSDEGLVVEHGKMFVLGDNRNIQGGLISMDSHIYGAWDTSTIVGKVIRVY